MNLIAQSVNRILKKIDLMWCQQQANGGGK